MFKALLTLRLEVLDSFNELTEGEQEATARAWVDIFEREASRLINGDPGWLPAGAEQTTFLRRRHAYKWGRLLGQVDARLSLILADQIVAALIRGNLTGVES